MGGWITAYEMFKMGFLPNQGGWLNQSNKFIEVMQFINIKINEITKEKLNGGKQRTRNNP